MAVKDHSLDDKIIKAAKSEFLEHGFREASLHKISARAGITTGALYTRYKNKDTLFCSLVEEMLVSMKEAAQPIYEKYCAVENQGDPDLIIDTIKEEMQIYLQLMFEYYDECVLFFCKSGGSSLDRSLKQMMEAKARTTIIFLEQFSGKEFDKEGVELIMTEQFNIYRHILEKGYSKEKAFVCMETVQNFLEAGWRDLFNRLM